MLCDPSDAQAFKEAFESAQASNAGVASTTETSTDAPTNGTAPEEKKEEAAAPAASATEEKKAEAPSAASTEKLESVEGSKPEDGSIEQKTVAAIEYVTV